MCSESAPSRRERQAAERRDRILNAAIQIFADKGFHRATTREIADAADVGEGTIFNYFGSKDDLLLAIIDRLADVAEQRRLARQTLEMNYREVLTAAMKNRIAHLDDSFQMFLAVFPEIVSSPDLRERFYDHYMRSTFEVAEEHLQGRVERGHVRPLDVPLTVRLFRSISLGLSIMAVLGDEVVNSALQDPDHLAESLATLIFDGIRKPE